nr:hypothetical protein [Terriglobus saanensis]
MKKCRSAREQAQLAGESCTGPATEREGDPAKSFAGAVAPPCITAYGPREWFGEDAARAAPVHTEKLAGSKRNLHRDTFPRQVCERTPVATVHPG